jgi:hypothetical protein
LRGAGCGGGSGGVGTPGARAVEGIGGAEGTGMRCVGNIGKGGHDGLTDAGHPGLSRCIAQVIRGIRTDIVARVLHRPIIAQASPKAFAGERPVTSLGV